MRKFLMRAGVLSLLVGTALPIAAASAAAQGQNDHDRPGTEQYLPPGSEHGAGTKRYGGDWYQDDDDDRYWGGGSTYWGTQPKHGWGNNWGNNWGGEHHILPKRKIVKLVHRQHFYDISRIRYDDGVYKLRARDRHGRPVKLIVDAYTGRILSRTYR